MNNIFKFLTVLSVLGLVACSSTGETEAVTTVQVPAVTTEVEVQMSEAERQALATTVFYFDYDSAELSAEDRSTLVYHAVQLKGNTDLSVRLEGHASEEGTREYNLALGERRAKSVAMFLMANGVSATQLEVVSYGEERPVVIGSDENARSKNRRVEIVK